MRWRYLSLLLLDACHLHFSCPTALLLPYCLYRPHLWPARRSSRAAAYRQAAALFVFARGQRDRIRGAWASQSLEKGSSAPAPQRKSSGPHPAHQTMAAAKTAKTGDTKAILHIP